MRRSPAALLAESSPSRQCIAVASGSSMRLVAVGAIVLAANAGLLVLQLVSGRLLAPFVGSSLETWTAIIASFLVGIALGNAVGGRYADHTVKRHRLAAFLTLGSLSALGMIAMPDLWTISGLPRRMPLSFRIPVLAFVLCFPPGFTLSLLTPFAVKLGTVDVRHAGRAAGTIFAMSSLGSVIGNYVTGFYLIPSLTVNHIVLAVAAMLGVLAVVSLAFFRDAIPSVPAPVGSRNGSTAPTLPTSRDTVLSFRTAAMIVFLASFAGMTLELTASRLLAQILGVSLFTWTGIIGVMLAGTAVGNRLGGVWSDRAGQANDPVRGLNRLATSLVLASTTMVLLLILFFIGVRAELFADMGIIARVLGWTFVLFFVPMLLLGTVSPQVIRLAVPDLQHTGRVAGRIYAVSTAGAIAGTLSAGFVLVSMFGMYRTILIAGMLPAVAALLTRRVISRPSQLYLLSIGMGGILCGMVLLSPENTRITRETNYYTITVTPEKESLLRPATAQSDAAVAVAGAAGLFDPPDTVLQLNLDTLTHSWVKPGDPTYLKYSHEQTQLEILWGVAATHPHRPKILVIGGGGYTFPRCVRTVLPSSRVDVVEIDPGVTSISYSHLHLDPSLGIRSHHMDGRQFISEQAGTGDYHLITLDAVNDLTVPYHLLTREFNEQVKRSLAPNGVYLLTVIDMLNDGELWKAAVQTLRQTFPHVQMIASESPIDPTGQQVYIIYASALPLNREFVKRSMAAQGRDVSHLHIVEIADRLASDPSPVILTDQFAPVDNMMADVFRRRQSKK